MKTVRMTRREAQLFYEHCTRCGRPPRSGGESREEVQKFKYAVGRNYQIASRIVDKTERLKIERAPNPPEQTPEIRAYERERENILMRNAKQNAGGQTVMRRDEQTGEVMPVIPTEARTIVMLAIDDLQVRYADAIKDWNALISVHEAAVARVHAEIDAETVEFEIYTYPFDKVPESISGTHIADLAPMLTGLPELSDENDLTPQDLVATDCAIQPDESE